MHDVSLIPPHEVFQCAFDVVVVVVIVVVVAVVVIVLIVSFIPPLLDLRWDTVGAEIKDPSAEKPELSKPLSLLSLA